MRFLLASLLVAAVSLSAIACSSESGSASGSSNTSGSGGGGGGSGSGGSGGGQATWTQLGLKGDRVPYLAVDRTSPSTIFVGTSQGSNDEGFFRTTDGGKTWPPAPQLKQVWPTGLAASPKQDITLADVGVDGISRSVDGGNTWTPTNFAGNSYGIWFDPNSSTVWLSDGAQIWRSADAGITWAKALNMGLPAAVSVEFPTFDGSKLYVAVGANGVYASSDGGNTFTAANTGLPSMMSFGDVIALAADPSRPGVVLAQTSHQGLYRTDDSGANWTKVDMGTELTEFGALLIDPTNPTTFYVGRDPSGLLRSTDDGKTWTSIGPDNVYVAAVDIDPKSGAVYAGTMGDGVWRLDK
jgi:photosystem II stability/assembly factor-like uncharacterized protein